MHSSRSGETKTDKDRRSQKWFVHFAAVAAAADDACCTLRLTHTPRFISVVISGGTRIIKADPSGRAA